MAVGRVEIKYFFRKKDKKNAARLRAALKVK